MTASALMQSILHRLRLSGGGRHAAGKTGDVNPAIRAAVEVVRQFGIDSDEPTSSKRRTTRLSGCVREP
jgi:hypothetical protein